MTHTHTRTNTKSLKPTAKWFAGLATGVVALVGNLIVSGDFTGSERGITFATIVILVIQYLKENANTPGGVPVK